MEVEPSFGTQKKCPFPLNRCFVYKDYKFSNLSNWKEEAWKKSGLQRDCSTNWAMKPHIGSEVNLLSSYLPWGVKWWEVYEIIHFWTAVVDHLQHLQPQFKNEWFHILHIKDYKIVHICLDQILCPLNVDFPYRLWLFCQYLIIGLD